MMDRKYELIAFTKDITDAENARIFMTEDLEWTLREPFHDLVYKCQRKEKEKNSIIDLTLAQEYVSAYEKCARFEFLVGDDKYGVIFLSKACEYAAPHDELADDFIRLRNETIATARKYGYTDLLRDQQWPFL